jgi:hypothetical protein
VAIDFTYPAESPDALPWAVRKRMLYCVGGSRLCYIALVEAGYALVEAGYALVEAGYVFRIGLCVVVSQCKVLWGGCGGL